MGDLILHGPTTSASTVAALDAFDELVGVRSTLFHCHFPAYYGTHPDGSDRWLPISISLAGQLRQRGQLALFTLGTWNLSTKRVWKPLDVTAGKYDAYLVAQAKALAAWTHPIVLRLDHEMNGRWAPWYTDGPSFVTLWRYVVTLFRSHGATNVSWHWCPNQLAAPGADESTAADRLAPYYPGDDVVDYAGFDAYNWGSPWLTFAEMLSGGVANLGDTYATVASVAPSKPMLLGEFGCPGVGGNRAAWLADALAIIPRQYPFIRGISYYHEDTSALRRDDGSAAAYADGIRSGPYARLGA